MQMVSILYSTFLYDIYGIKFKSHFHCNSTMNFNSYKNRKFKIHPTLNISGNKRLRVITKYIFSFGMISKCIVLEFTPFVIAHS